MHCVSTAKWLQECATMLEHTLTTLFFPWGVFLFYMSFISQTNSSVSSSLISTHIIPCFCVTSFLSCRSHLGHSFAFYIYFYILNLLWNPVFLFFLKTCPCHCILFLVNLCSKAFIFKSALNIPSHFCVLCLFLLYFCWS